MSREAACGSTLLALQVPAGESLALEFPVPFTPSRLPKLILGGQGFYPDCSGCTRSGRGKRKVSAHLHVRPFLSLVLFCIHVHAVEGRGDSES